MEINVSSLQELWTHLIFLAIQRCRLLDDLCRLSVKLRSIPQSDRSVVQISTAESAVSDTGIGSTLEELQILRCQCNSTLAGSWDGIISITTTSINENEIRHANLNMKDADPTARMTKLAPTVKNAAKFSGTEVLLSINGYLDDILPELTFFLRRLLVLQVPVAIELIVDSGSMVEPQPEKCKLAAESNTFSPANVESLKVGFTDYILKHGNRLDSICHSCFSGEPPKVGSGVALRSRSPNNNPLVMEAVIVVSETSELPASSCLRTCNARSEILFFKDFSPHSVSQPLLDALESINWKTYGLNLRSIADHDGSLFLEWDDLSPFLHINIAFHCYFKQVMMPPSNGKKQPDRSLYKKAIKLALDELKKKNDGAFLSKHACKLCSYVPDLAKTVAGLILSSNDLHFKRECFDLLGLDFQQDEKEAVESCIQKKIMEAIKLSDMRSRTKETTAFLFRDDVPLDFGLVDEANEEYTLTSSSMEL